jgi:excisionase family DNA binding protein
MNPAKERLIMATTKMKPRTGRESPLQEVLTLEEAAAYLRVSETEVLRMLREQHLPGRLIGKEWRFSASGLQDWLREGPSENEKLMRLAGAWKDDPHLEEIVRQAYRQRGGSLTEIGQ